ncbi:MAG: PH domain-containing protein [Intrasporangium sp.]|uniref:PH domain-containing protein n=1 Tax=Intrasporangium sp. TaxID=1925024 RepID=UPI0026481964|nr:PH domain-containing protein [Intrasporangium sp.]MDN5797919.1 PH domain-containing protein [Intrasporangium sp.]
MALLRPDIPTAVATYLLPGEQVVAAVHHHWARVAEPIGTAGAGLIVALWVDSNITAPTEFVATVVWLGFLLILARALWHLIEWRHDWFVATDKRLLLRYGLVTHKVAMMPLLKVTDMSYVRSVPGQLLGYGQFIMESAGQDQALRVVNWVPRPDETYRAICGQIFQSAPDAEAEPGPDTDDGPGGDSAPDQPPGFPDVPSTHSAVQDRLDSWSRALPVQGGEQVYASEDIRESRRGAKTGPIEQRPGRRWRRGNPSV